ncbi:MAG: P-loop NTPase [Candidatus Kapabacteria bacterium]|nr:P-loop NTPase [Ignavibacteriota bacterium]MCW5883498.1 P-loop NTPase [Candidatus Kapabacteria bacterium]
MKNPKTNIKSTGVITFCSGKGGVGKSVITANTASALGMHSSVLVLDSVTDLPNQHIIFGVEPPIRLMSVLSGHVMVESAAFQINKNVSLLVDSPLEVGEENNSVLELTDVVADLKFNSEFDYLIIDTHSGISDQLVEFCYMSDLVVVLITDEPTSLLDAYGLVKVLVNFIDSKKIVLLVNNVIDSEDAEEISEKLNLATTKFLNMNLEVLGFVPYSRNVRKSIQRQELLTLSNKDDDATKAIMSIANKIHTKYFKDININTVDFELMKAL